MENVQLATQTEIAFLALEAREHVGALENILAYGRLVQNIWASGCSVAETRALLVGVSYSEVN